VCLLFVPPNHHQYFGSLSSVFLPQLSHDRWPGSLFCIVLLTSVGRLLPSKRLSCFLKWLLLSSYLECSSGAQRFIFFWLPPAFDFLFPPQPPSCHFGTPIFLPFWFVRRADIPTRRCTWKPPLSRARFTPESSICSAPSPHSRGSIPTACVNFTAPVELFDGFHFDTGSGR